MADTSFIIRVYGIFIDARGLLVSDEIVYGKEVTKFPGGGLEFGEGTIDCLKREMLEETGSEFKILSHFYTTDFFVESAFHKARQVISIYYFVQPVDELRIRIANRPFDFENAKTEGQSFRFIPVSEISSEKFTLIIDQKVASLLKDAYK